ncbi:MAG: hypothetical protein NPIRA05_20320 [Nitrospirales bacterium]|nr:MAG: hypothetical protein NPIRA05_20320 [Nitrospirales bacterium]
MKYLTLPYRLKQISLIMGTLGWAGIDRVMMGSVAERVICKAPCPPLSIRNMEHGQTTTTGQPKGETAGTTPRHILLPIDFSDCSLEAYEYAGKLKKSFDASITLRYFTYWNPFLIV